MRLTELEPAFLDAGGPGVTDRDGNTLPERKGVAIMFNCPCGCDRPCYIPFANPLDGGPARIVDGKPVWQRTGDTFETLSLTPSILRDPAKGGCGWHGFIRNGEIV